MLGSPAPDQSGRLLKERCSIQHHPPLLCLSPGVFNQGEFSQPCPEPRLVVPGLGCLSTYVLTTGVGETLLRVLQIAGVTCAFR